jgi:hypothetical protein
MNINKSGISEQVLSLPKGSGAIQCSVQKIIFIENMINYLNNDYFLNYIFIIFNFFHLTFIFNQIIIFSFNINYE